MLNLNENCNKINCPSCHNHFFSLKSNIEKIVITKHFEKDVKDDEKISRIEREVLNCDNSMDLHKFEEHIKGIPIFRAKIDNVHYVFAIKDKELVFMRAFHNFKRYKEFLGDENMIMKALPV